MLKLLLHQRSPLGIPDILLRVAICEREEIVRDEGVH
jgi:hypothetical protein